MLKISVRTENMSILRWTYEKVKFRGSRTMSQDGLESVLETLTWTHRQSGFVNSMKFLMSTNAKNAKSKIASSR